MTSAIEEFIRVGRNAHQSRSTAFEKRSQRENSVPRKPNNIVVGRKVVDGLVSWRGADMTTELYIGNVTVNVSCEEAHKAISDLGVDVIELEVVARHKHFQSFRLRIKPGCTAGWDRH